MLIRKAYKFRIYPGATQEDLFRRVLSAHVAALEARGTKNSRLWGQPFTVDNILDTLEAALASPPSKQTRGKL
jgi:Helix-turn-helix domain